MKNQEKKRLCMKCGTQKDVLFRFKVVVKKPLKKGLSMKCGTQKGVLLLSAYTF